MAGVVAMGALTVACSGSSVTRTAGPATNTDDIGADVPVRVTASAVKPSLLHLFNGLQATFVNEDTVPRTVAVDAARSEQAGCSAVGVVLQPGERRTTAVLPRFAALLLPRRAASRPTPPSRASSSLTRLRAEPCPRQPGSTAPRRTVPALGGQARRWDHRADVHDRGRWHASASACVAR